MQSGAKGAEVSNKKTQKCNKKHKCNKCKRGFHGFKKRTPKHETLFGEPGRLHVYLTYGSYHCVNIVTHKKGWASGVLLRSIAMPNENERVGSGPGLLANRFGLNRSHDNCLISVENGIWLSKSSFNADMKNIENNVF